MQINKADLTVGGSTSGGHLLLVQFEGPLEPPLGGKTIRILLGNFPEVDPVTVTWVSEGEFKFTGPVVVWASGRGRKSEAIIFCSGVGGEPNKVVATVSPL